MSHRARKRFGQNFLHDRRIIQKIIQSIAPSAEDALVEIGPGQGAITLELLKTAKHLHAIELDRDLIEPLRIATANVGDLTLHNVDALRFDFSSLIDDNQNKLRIVGNLPYNISTPILFHLLSQLSIIGDMHFMLQKEVVERMAAAPGSKVYGRLSIMIQIKCQVRSLFDIGPGAFRPAPKVDSSFVRLTPLQQPPLITDFAHLQSIVTQAFSKRRKTLRNSLKGSIEDSIFENTNIDPSLRPETLSPEQFISLSNEQTASLQE